MIDRRKSLNEGHSLILGDITYEIKKEIGRGGSCIVYEAEYSDNLGLPHTVRIKECYPYSLEIGRDCEGALCVADSFRLDFELACKKYRDAYKKNTLLQTTLGLINAVPQAENIYKCGNTVYIVIAVSEGTVFSKYQASSLKELISIMKALAGIIHKFHKEGYLYLDIKPDNIYILPETKDHLLLFDFDSLISVSELQESQTTKISFSNGFAAPELARGKREKIGIASDVYSIGAVVFYKIFNRVPGMFDRESTCIYDYTYMNFKDDRYQPELFRLLNQFFFKTLSLRPENRFSSMEEVAEALSRLEELSDVEAVYLLSTMAPEPKFSFSGRGRELEALDKAIQEGNIVFLSGMGGIGKTEITKKYAYDFSTSYDTITFARYANSLRETICSDDFDINNLNRQEGEDEQEYYERKYNVLKGLDSKALIIIDNFDVPADKLSKDSQILSDISQLKCKVLFTSRMTYFRDFGFHQIDIKALDDVSDLLKIFSAYNQNTYTEEELKEISELIEFVDRHTMTVDLLAKYLRMTGEAPSEVLHKMKSTMGVTNTTETPVLSEKDFAFNIKSVNQHLLSLFNIFGFSEEEKEFLMSLSLLGPVRIRKELFFKIYKKDASMDILSGLAYKGWIEDDGKGKIALHQIILDLIYKELHPDTEKCGNMTVQVIEYIKTKEKSTTLNGYKKKLLKIFRERIKGNNLLKAKFNIAYCRYLSYDEKLIKETDEICCTEDTKESHLIRCENISLQIMQFKEECDWTDFENLSQQFKELYDKILQAEHQVFKLIRSLAKVKGKKEETMDVEKAFPSFGEEQFQRIFSNAIELDRDVPSIADDDIIDCFYHLACAIEKVTSKVCQESFEIDASTCTEIESLYLDANSILEYAANLMENASIAPEIKEKVYLKQIEFYSDDDYGNLARCSVLASPAKSAFVSEKLYDIRHSNEDAEYVLDLDIVSNLEAADQAFISDNLVEAEKMYLKALEKNEVTDDYIKSKLSTVYSRMGNFRLAEKMLLEVLEYDIKQGNDLCFVFEELMLLYEKNNNREKALHFCEEIIALKEKKINNTPVAEKNDLTQLLYCYGKRATYNRIGSLSSSEMDACGKYFSVLQGEKHPDENLVEIISLYANELKKHGKAGDGLQILYAFGKLYIEDYSYREANDLLKEAVTTEAFYQEDPKRYVLSLLLEAEAYINLLEEAGIEYALKLCEEANERMSIAWAEYEYLQALYYQTQIDIHNVCYMDFSYEETQALKEKCNYYLITEHRISECGLQDSVYQMWKDCYRAYDEVANFAMQAKCLQQMRKQLSAEDIIKEEILCLGDGIDYFTTAIGYYQKTGEHENLLECLNELYIALDFFPISSDDQNQRALLQMLGETANILTELKHSVAAFYLLILKIMLLYRPEVFQSIYHKGSLYEVNKDILSDALYTLESILSEDIVNNDNLDFIMDAMKQIVTLADYDNDNQDLIIFFSEKIQAYSTSFIELK